MEHMGKVIKIDIETAEAAIKENQEIGLLVVSKERLILGEGVKDEELLKKVEKTINKKIVEYEKPRKFTCFGC